MSANSDRHTLKIVHRGNPANATLQLTGPDGKTEPMDLVERIRFDSDANGGTKLSLDFMFCFGTLEIEAPVDGEVISRFVTGEQFASLVSAVRSVPRKAIEEAPEWAQRLHRVATAMFADRLGERSGEENLGMVPDGNVRP